MTNLSKEEIDNIINEDKEFFLANGWTIDKIDNKTIYTSPDGKIYDSWYYANHKAQTDLLKTKKN